MKTHCFDAIIVGAGAAGMMYTGSAGQRGGGKTATRPPFLAGQGARRKLGRPRLNILSRTAPRLAGCKPAPGPAPRVTRLRSPLLRPRRPGLYDVELLGG